MYNKSIFATNNIIIIITKYLYGSIQKQNRNLNEINIPVKVLEGYLEEIKNHFGAQNRVIINKPL